KNAQSRLMIEEMDHAFSTANADEDVRVIILAAAGDTFSSGHDIGTPEEREDMRRRPFPKGVSGEYALSRHLFLDTTLRWRDLDKPTIAKLQGMCFFGGWMFAAAMAFSQVRTRPLSFPVSLLYRWVGIREPT